MTGARSTPRGLAEQDAAALLGTTAVISALLLAGQLDARTTDQVRRRFVSVGLLPEQSGPEHLLVALSGMTERLRYALGEYPDPPVPSDGSGVQSFLFADGESAAAFCVQIRRDGDQSDNPQDTGETEREDRWRVDVLVSELLLSANFEVHGQTLEKVANQHGGRRGGWSARSPHELRQSKRSH